MEVEKIRSVEDLTRLIESGVNPKYVFFWGHTQRYPDRVDQSCLSDWFPSEFEVDGINYPTTEHFMMAEKARLFGDEDIRKQIIESSSPGKAKSLGRCVQNFNENIWINHRFDIVVKGNASKFIQKPELSKLLIKTGSKVLVEASPQDRIWGIGLPKDDSRSQNPNQWNGLNLLGFALMEVRELLK